MAISAVILYNDNRVSVYSEEAKYVGKTFQKGIYKCSTDRNGNVTIQKIELPEVHYPYNTKDNKMILKTVNAFFKTGVRERVNQFGYIHKLGILLYGKQGCGKTSMLNYIVEKLMYEKKAIVFYCDNENELTTCMSISKQVRKIQDNPIIFVADEIDKYCRDSESELKQFLDGKDSIDNSLFLAATNYLERIPDTIKNRPSRFKIVHEMKGIQDEKFIETVIRGISERTSPPLLTEEKIKEAIKELQEPTIDDIKQLCIDHITENFIPKGIKKSVIGFKQSIVKDEEDEDEDDSELTRFKIIKLLGKTINLPPTSVDTDTSIPSSKMEGSSEDDDLDDFNGFEDTDDDLD